MDIKVFSWNVGSGLPFVKVPGLMRVFGHEPGHEFFQKSHAGLVSEKIKQLNPDIVVLQEIQCPDNATAIAALDDYPHQHYIDTWYGENMILLASKDPVDVVSENKVFEIHGINILPVHFDSYSAGTRAQDVSDLLQRLASSDRAIILGDTNLWNWSGKFLFEQDRLSYEKLAGSLLDVTVNFGSGCYTRAALDKILVKGPLKDVCVECLSHTSWSMDHYPVSARIAFQ